MLTCAEFADRLYDEDCRRALAGERPASPVTPTVPALPPDIAPHLLATLKRIMS